MSAPHSTGAAQDSVLAWLLDGEAAVRFQSTRDLLQADGRWPVHRGYPGETHLPPPRAGTANRWVTLRALRVLQAYPADPR